MFPHLQEHSGVCACACLVGETEPYLVLFLGPWRAIASANQSSLGHRNKVWLFFIPPVILRYCSPVTKDSYEAPSWINSFQKSGWVIWKILIRYLLIYILLFCWFPGGVSFTNKLINTRSFKDMSQSQTHFQRPPNHLIQCTFISTDGKFILSSRIKAWCLMLNICYQLRFGNALSTPLSFSHSLSPQ